VSAPAALLGERDHVVTASGMCRKLFRIVCPTTQRRYVTLSKRGELTCPACAAIAKVEGR
jgi:hypothetical protein